MEVTVRRVWTVTALPKSTYSTLKIFRTLALLDAWLRAPNHVVVQIFLWFEHFQTGLISILLCLK